MSVEGVSFTSPDFLIPTDERFAYGIESIEIKKHEWPAENSVMFGALFHDASSGTKFFVTLGDLARYEAFAQPPAKEP
jgi:hypothetical protein